MKWMMILAVVIAATGCNSYVVVKEELEPVYDALVKVKEDASSGSDRFADDLANAAAMMEKARRNLPEDRRRCDAATCLEGAISFYQIGGTTIAKGMIKDGNDSLERARKALDESR